MSFEEEKDKRNFTYGNRKIEGKCIQSNRIGKNKVSLNEISLNGVTHTHDLANTPEINTYYYENAKPFQKRIENDNQNDSQHLDGIVGKKFGDIRDLLLDSATYVAGESKTPKIDINLNPGLNDKTVDGLLTTIGKETFDIDTYKSFIKNFGFFVLCVPKAEFKHNLQSIKSNLGVKLVTELKTEVIKNIITGYKFLIKEKKVAEFPQDLGEQLKKAIHADIRSWNKSIAITIRNINSISNTWNTHVKV